MKKQLIVEKIKKVLSTAKHGNIGYLGIYLNGDLIGHIDTEDGFEIELKKDCDDTTIDKVVNSDHCKLTGDYYGDMFSGFLIEDIRFYK